MSLTPAARFIGVPVLSLSLLLFTAGCSTLGEIGNPRERPESLDPVPVEVAPGRAYEEALTLAFDRGYQIVYSDDEDRLIELESLDRRFIGTDRVRRIDLFVRSANGTGGQARIHARVHSFSADDPGDIAVRDEDREAARELLDRLVARLEGHPLPHEPDEGATS